MGKQEREPILIIQQPGRTEYVDRHITVTEKRALTDESVKLLREMETKAEAEVVKAVSVSNTIFECVVHQSLDYLSDRVKWRAVFKLNDKQLTANVETDPRGGIADNFAALRDEMAKIIAREVLNDAFIATMRAVLGRRT